MVFSLAMRRLPLLIFPELSIQLAMELTHAETLSDSMTSMASQPTGSCLVEGLLSLWTSPEQPRPARKESMTPAGLWAFTWTPQTLLMGSCSATEALPPSIFLVPRERSYTESPTAATWSELMKTTGETHMAS